MTARDLRRAGLLPDPLAPVLVLLAVVVAACSAGCGPRNPLAKVFLRDAKNRDAGLGYSDGAPHVAVVTTGGVMVDYPIWLDYADNAQHRVAMFDEIANTKPDADPRIDPSLRGVPAGLKVVVLSGRFYTPASPTGLANGLTDAAAKTIYVAWRDPSSRGLRLPALGHELHHYWTGDPRAGH